MRNRHEKIRRYTGSLQVTPRITQTTARCRLWHTGKNPYQRGKIHSSSATV